MSHGHWVRYALLTAALWGVWGAFTGLPSEHGFPDTLTYGVWALTMIAPAVWVMRRSGARLQRDRRSVFLGLAIGLLGAGGQMLLFRALTSGPPYLIFPIVSLSPVITIAMSLILLGERAGKLGVAGIVLAVLSLPLFDYSPGPGAHHYGAWFYLALAVMVAWGLQAYFIKLANATMSAESIFAYMMITGLMFIPVAIFLTDFSGPVNCGLSGPWLAAVIQLLNAVGALFLVYAFRYGKAIVVSPLVNAGAPLLTSVISLAIAGSLPGSYKLAGIMLALSGALLLSLQPE
ncbi:MAG TPA: EamA family transporter [Gemmatimonadales bacterium]|nr:MAG: DMT family transporter [Gammaproteobacteria bacterium]TLZ26377.1 MAG: DMT family transporter [Gammaproteobacteria bacterium]TLZ45565.1 MAG: DMT family transporter [Gammaproteobacteria bacterium]HXG98497.1 EamA family transporter [Gemmatimonadales bacterium]